MIFGAFIALWLFLVVGSFALEAKVERHGFANLVRLTRLWMVVASLVTFAVLITRTR